MTTANKPLNTALREALSCIDQQQFADAAKIVSSLEATNPEIGDVWGLKSELNLRQGKWNEAIEAVERALVLDGSTAHRLVQKARCYGLAGKSLNAKAAVEQALQTGASQPEQLTLLASVLARCNAYPEALDLYGRALAGNPNDIEALRGCATVHRFLGNIAEAEKYCDRVIGLMPHDFEIINLRSSLRKQSVDDNHLLELTGMLNSRITDWRGAVQLAYAVFKEYDDIGEYDKAFYHLSNGAKIRRRFTQYDIKEDIAIFERLKDCFSREALDSAEGRGNKSDKPIFVLGMPRTGSTLVDRIVSSHNAVESAGELNDFAFELMALATEMSGGTIPSRLDLPKLSLSLEFERLGTAYLEATDEMQSGARHFIDKLPLNSLYIGLIHLSLPNAKIVHVTRDPMDACFAIFRYLFNHAYPFSYDLRELAQYYAAYAGLMDHWRRVLPGKIIDVRYEDLVSDQEQVTRSLITKLGLEWDDACLQFHRNPAASTTGSASQVRNPIYRSSVKKWKFYEAHLQPLKDALEEFGLRFDD